MLIDTHCHLNFPDYEKDIDSVIKSAHETGVERIINVGADLESSQKAVEIAQKYDCCFASVGIHPHHADQLENGWEEKLNKIARQKKVIAVGECGLDYYTQEGKNIPESKFQKDIFEKQIKLAQKLNLPLIIHDRKAHDGILEILNRCNGLDHLTGVFHCYSMGKSGIEKVNQLGFFFGLDGNLTYDEGLQNVVKLIPIEKILLETDSPWLTPAPYRNQRNEPENVTLISECLAKIKNITPDEVANITTQNARSIFEPKA